jgi:glycosyltransferase involved in cell wall biosynthesis
MTIRILHVVDEKTPEDARRLLNLLLQNLPADRVYNELVFIGPPPQLVRPATGTRTHYQGRRLPGPLGTAMQLRQKLKTRDHDVVHAWGASAAEIAEHAFADRLSTVTTLSDPEEFSYFQKTWKRLEIKGGVGSLFVGSDAVRQQLAEAGLPAQAINVLPPMVDVEAIRETGKSVKRSDLGLPEEAGVILTPAPPTRAAGHFYCYWATAVLQVLRGDLRVIIPGRSQEQYRLRRLRQQTINKNMFIFPENRWTAEQLLAVSDLFVLPAIENVALDWPARALAAGVPIVASRIPAIEELITHERNGRLCPPGQAHLLAIEIRRTLENLADARKKAADAAPQAQQAYAPQQFVSRYLEVLEHHRSPCSATDIR